MAALRGCGWEGLPPPPVFTTGEPKPSRKDPTATPTSLGLPNREFESLSLRLESSNSETDTSPASPITRSPSPGIVTLSDFTVTDISDDEFSIGPMAVAPHETFYLEDGNAEVLCKNTLFRVHASSMSFHSPTLRRMFAQTSLAKVESPNGCPRLLSSDTPKDFATLLKIVYLPGFVAPPAHR